MRRAPSTACAAFLGALAACFPIEPTPFQRGDEIPLGPWTAAVRSVEAMSADLLPGAAQIAGRPGSRLLVVHVEIERNTGEGDAEEGPSEAQKRFLKLLSGVRLEDGQGREYRIGLPLPQAHYQMMKMGSAWSGEDMLNWTTQLGRWVILFGVPSESEDFTLFVRNFWPTDGQVRLAAVDLGR